MSVVGRADRWRGAVAWPDVFLALASVLLGCSGSEHKPAPAKDESNLRAAPCKETADCNALVDAGILLLSEGPPWRCALGRCIPEPAACASGVCAVGSCVKNLRAYCPDCTRDVGCWLSIGDCGSAIAAEDCLDGGGPTER